MNSCYRRFCKKQAPNEIVLVRGGRELCGKIHLAFAHLRAALDARGHSLMVKFQPSKLAMRVRSPLPAYNSVQGIFSVLGRLLRLRQIRRQGFRRFRTTRDIHKYKELPCWARRSLEQIGISGPSLVRKLLRICIKMMKIPSIQKNEGQTGAQKKIAPFSTAPYSSKRLGKILASPHRNVVRISDRAYEKF